MLKKTRWRHSTLLQGRNSNSSTEEEPYVLTTRSWKSLNIFGGRGSDCRGRNMSTCHPRTFRCREYIEGERCPLEPGYYEQTRFRFGGTKQQVFSFHNFYLLFLLYSCLFFIITSFYICSFPVPLYQDLYCGLIVWTLHTLSLKWIQTLIVMNLLLHIDPFSISTGTLDVCKTVLPPSFWLH